MTIMFCNNIAVQSFSKHYKLDASSDIALDLSTTIVSVVVDKAWSRGKLRFYYCYYFCYCLTGTFNFFLPTVTASSMIVWVLLLFVGLILTWLNLPKIVSWAVILAERPIIILLCSVLMLSGIMLSGLIIYGKSETSTISKLLRLAVILVLIMCLLFECYL